MPRMFTGLISFLPCLLASVAVLPAQEQPTPVVVIETNVGDITAELYPERAPLSVENFLKYAEDGFYSGTIFHRVQRGVIIQGGGFTPGLQLKRPRPPVKSEALNRLKNEHGTLAMARSGGIHSATSQFFINLKHNRDFDHKGLSVREYGYTVFGKVIEGMNVVSTIADIETTKRNGMRDVPTVLIIIKNVRLVK